MAVGEICTRDVVFARQDESVAVGAGLMRKHHVGSLVIVDETSGKRRPAGSSRTATSYWQSWRRELIPRPSCWVR